MISTKIAARLATKSQFDFIKRLLAERDASHLAVIVDNCRTRAVAGIMTAQEASSLIDLLKEQPYRADEAKAQDEPEAGIYGKGADLYRVYLGQNAGRMLVKKIEAERTGTKCYCSDLQGVLCGVCRGEVEPVKVEAVTYTYLGAAARHLPEGANRLSAEELGFLGRAWSHCVICGRRLDDPESVDRGMGPVCAKNY